MTERIEKLHGDASYRTYSRAHRKDGTTYIMMQMPEGKASASEEITNFKGRVDELPFINVQKFLKSLGMPVPEIYSYDSKKRLMKLEDLGDDLMAKNVSDADEKTKLDWYRKAVDLLVLMQTRASSAANADCVANKRSFDAVLLNWEFDHFREYGIEARSGVKMSPEDLAIFEKETRAITKQIEAMQYGFTHRDFQSRNIIVRDGRFYLIDFQDALRGPYVYDLVALTRDSYVELQDATLASLLEYYAKTSGRDLSDVKRDFALVTVQRKLKDAGRFVYIDRVKKNSSFLQYIPVSLSYVKKALSGLPEHRNLLEVLKKYVPEWK